MRGGPGTSDPTRLIADSVSLFNLVQMAYYLRAEYQLSGPDWMRSALFDIVAKVPPGATKRDVHLMLRKLLAERFELVFHREKKEMPGYTLIVGRDGVRLQPAKALASPEASDAGSLDPPPITPPQYEKNGCPIIPVGSRASRIGGRGLTTGNFLDESMTQFGDALSEIIRRPVTDATGLTGRYDFTLCWASDPGRLLSMETAAPEGASDPTGGLSVFDAIQKRLGLKLVPGKSNVSMFVVDRALRVPIQN
jgi:uncharacterized protein (TIGR03435 family)